MNVRVIPRLVTLALLIAFAATVFAGRVQAQVSTAVEIENVALSGTTVTITGKNFGSAAPAVTIGENTAVVTRSSDTEIVAEAAALPAGVHIITIVRDASEGGSAKSTLLVR